MITISPYLLFPHPPPTLCTPGVKVDPHKKQLHLTLAYQFNPSHTEPLINLSKEVDIKSAARWEFRLYSRDPRAATAEVKRHKSGIVEGTLWTPAFTFPLTHLKLPLHLTGKGVDALIRLWTNLPKVKGQRSLKFLLRMILSSHNFG